MHRKLDHQFQTNVGCKLIVLRSRGIGPLPKRLCPMGRRQFSAVDTSSVRVVLGCPVSSNFLWLTPYVLQVEVWVQLPKLILLWVSRIDKWPLLYACHGCSFSSLRIHCLICLSFFLICSQNVVCRSVASDQNVYLTIHSKTSFFAEVHTLLGF